MKALERQILCNHSVLHRHPIRLISEPCPNKWHTYLQFFNHENPPRAKQYKNHVIALRFEVPMVLLFSTYSCQVVRVVEMVLIITLRKTAY